MIVVERIGRSFVLALKNNMMFAVVERIGRSFVFCGWRVHSEGSIVELFG